jgi:hypothetical protein
MRSELPPPLRLDIKKKRRGAESRGEKSWERLCGLDLDFGFGGLIYETKS